MLWQLHHQFKDGHTEMVAQQDFPQENFTSAFQDWLREIALMHPLPAGAIWMWCNEESPDFVWAAK
jgi:hypothetical protein